MRQITVIHENSAWVEPLRQAFDEQSLPFGEWFLDEGGIENHPALEESSRFDRVWVQPAAGNSGTALGAALSAWHQTLGREERSPLETLLLGPVHGQEEIKQILENCKLRFTSTSRPMSHWKLTSRTNARKQTN